MNSLAPKIGFDRFIPLAWVTEALRVRAGGSNLPSLDEMIAAENLGVAATKKTRTVLNRLWLEPRPELVGFADRGIEIFKTDPDVSVPVLCWGMAIATYPFFGKVAELVGRLSALQGDCTSAEVHRRMSETFGEREGTKRMTNMVLQTQANWGAIQRVDRGKRLIRTSPIILANDPLIAWLIEGALRYAGKAVSVPALQAMAVIYPFVMDRPIGFVVSNSTQLELRVDGASKQLVSLLVK